MPHKISHQVLDTLLDKLSSDDEFRGRFEKDPQQALASIGEESAKAAKPGERGVWTCCTVIKLASKEQIQASRKELSKQLGVEGVFSPFHLEAQ